MDVIGFFAASISLIAYLPQAIKTIRTRHTKSLSLPTFLAVCLSATLWTVYGFELRRPAIWFTNIVIVACSFVIVTLKLKEDK